MHMVIEIINEVCFNYKSSLSVQNRQNMAVSFPLPAPEDVYNVVSTSSLKNSRRKMEDRSIVIHDLNTIFIKQDSTPSHYYAVFDGHDGDLAAVYGANHLHQYLAESTNFITDPEQAIRDAFCKTDSMFVKKCETDNILGGTTAVCALLLPKEKTLYVAWAGDSQAIMVSRGKVLPCVVPHRPDREDERERIIKDGGMVLHWGVWRVNGQLSVSRAIGDADYKPYVTAIPEVVKLALSDEEDFIVLASDGLWDYVSDIEVATIVYDAVYNDPEKAKTCARELVQTAKQCGSGDNISVIVVFLRDPYQISDGPRWNNRLVSMDTLNNANIPFDMPNKTANNVDSLTTAHTEEGMLLNFAEGLKKNDDLPNNDLIKMLEKSNNGDRLSPSDFDKEDNLGPETNVDNPDDGTPAIGSPNFDTMKRHRSSEALNNNQNNCNNPFNDIEKTLELNLNLKEGTFEGLTSPEEEKCAPAVNSVHNVPQLIDAGAESDSEEEEEWNYVRGEEANKENNPKPLQLSSKVAEEEEEDLENAMSQLNPNAAEFVPSPARAVASPLGRLLDEDQVLSRSPKKPPPTEVDINVPNLCDFEKDISLKPGEMEESFSNGHQDGFNNDTNAINALNSRLDEFHFGRNAVPFTPVRLLDQSEASSTRANFGDESELTFGTSFNDSVLSQDQNDFVQKDDPMSMSFHQDRSDDSNLFDLNKVHVLPEDVDEFIAKEDNTNPLFDDTISDLTEHYPLGNSEEKSQQNENEFTTDLDHEDNKIEHLDIKQSSTPKEDRAKSPIDLMSPLEEDRSVTPREEPKTPSSTGDCELPKVEEHLATTQAEEDNRSNRPHSPFKDEHLISPVEEQKSVSPYEEKELYSNHEEKDICSPVEEKDVCCLMGKQNEPQNEKEVFEEKDLVSEKDLIQEEKLMEDKHLVEDKEKEVTEEKAVFEEDRIPSPEQQSVCLAPVETVASPVSERDLISPIQDVQISSLQEERELLGAKSPSGFGMEPAVSPKPEEVAPEVERQIASPVQEATSPALTDRDIVSPVQEEEITSIAQEVEMASPSQEECSLVDKAESPLLEQDVSISTAEMNEEDVVIVHHPESFSGLVNESFKVTTTCDNNLESSTHEEVPVASETSQNIEEFLRFESVKSEEDTAKEKLEEVKKLDDLNTVLSPEEKCVSPADEVVADEHQIPDSFNEISGESVENRLDQSQASPVKEEAEQSGVPMSLDIDTNKVDLHSQPTPEADNILIDVSDLQNSLNKSGVDTSLTSINTEDINSFLNRSRIGALESPLSPNKSADIINRVEAEQTEDISSPLRDQQPDLFKVTSSTPVENKVETSQPLLIQPVVDDKAAKPKEEDKKPATKGKPTTAPAAKKTPSARTSLAATKSTTKPSPKPATKTIPKTTSVASKVNSITKTETAAPKMASKLNISAAPKPGTTTTTARVPLSSRTKLAPKTNETNGTARPASKQSTGAIKKTTEGSSTKSTTATSATRTSTTARSTLASARSATTTIAQPKPRPTTLKSAPTKTVDAPKPTSATARTTTTANRVPLTSRTAATKTSSLLANKDAASKTLSKTRSVTDKQVKESTNKITAASRTVTKTTGTVQSLAKTTTVTKKTEITGSKTATNRTTTSARAPIKRPTTDMTKTATTTKVGKPKQNGVAPVVTEKIIVNNSSKELNSVNSTNGDQEFVKDNSPIDNKLITESAAN